MEGDPRQPAKLQKRKSRERQELLMSGGLAGQPANTSQPMAPSNNVSSAEDKKKSKFRLSNPFHSKDKDKEINKTDLPKALTEDKSRAPHPETSSSTTDTNTHRKRDTMETNVDSAYGSSTSANPSFASTYNARPVSDEQWHPPPASTRASTTTPPPQHTSLAPPTHSLQNKSSHENISRETYRDASTGCVVTTTTTVCFVQLPPSYILGTDFTLLYRQLPQQQRLLALAELPRSSNRSATIPRKEEVA
jgi:hypothetical protein